MAGKKLSGVYVSWPRPSFTSVVKTNKTFRTNFHMAVMYAHYELSAIELKKEVVKNLKTIDVKHPLLDRIKDIHENRFITVGKYMYILNHGGDLPDDIGPRLMPALQKVIDEEEARIAEQVKESLLKAKTEIKVDESPKQVISIQDRLRDRVHEVAGEVEGWIDDFCMNKKSDTKSVEEFVNLFKSADLKAPHMRYMNTIFARRVEEVDAAVNGNDKYLLEGYSNFTKPELKKFDLFHKNLIKACNMLQEVAKAERVPRKKKPVSTDKIISKLKYKKEDSSLGIVSISPSQILGSKEVWVYNVKTRKLSQYKSADATGLSVKGTSLVNYSTDSVEKTLRKPIEGLAEFKKATKVKLRTFLKDLSTVDMPCGGKINEHHVILRVYK